MNIIHRTLDIYNVWYDFVPIWSLFAGRHKCIINFLVCNRVELRPLILGFLAAFVQHWIKSRSLSPVVMESLSFIVSFMPPMCTHSFLPFLLASIFIFLKGFSILSLVYSVSSGSTTNTWGVRNKEILPMRFRNLEISWRFQDFLKIQRFTKDSKIFWRFQDFLKILRFLH